MAALGLGPYINFHRYSLFGQTAKTYSARAIELVRGTAVVDMLSPLSLSGAAFFFWRMGNFAADFQRLRESGITVFHIAAAHTGPPGKSAFVDPYLAVLRAHADYNGIIAEFPDQFLRINKAKDIARAKAAGKTGVLIGVQDSTHFRTLDDIGEFHRLGQRVSQLTYNARNLIGSGASERRDDGLSDFGALVVERMNQIGMAVDVSHCGDRTTLDALEVSRKPVLITHSNCRALNAQNVRCKTDDAIKKMAARGGVIGMTMVRSFVSAVEPTSIEQWLDHYAYAAKLVGVEHLGIGSDTDLRGYDAMGAAAVKALRERYKSERGYDLREKIDLDGVDYPKRIYDLTEGLIRRGFTDGDITGILGGNAIRVLTSIWGS